MKSGFQVQRSGECGLPASGRKKSQSNPRNQDQAKQREYDPESQNRPSGGIRIIVAFIMPVAVLAHGFLLFVLGPSKAYRLPLGIIQQPARR